MFYFLFLLAVALFFLAPAAWPIWLLLAFGGPLLDALWGERAFKSEFSATPNEALRHYGGSTFSGVGCLFGMIIWGMMILLGLGVAVEIAKEYGIDLLAVLQ